MKTFDEQLLLASEGAFLNQILIFIVNGIALTINLSLVLIGIIIVVVNCYCRNSCYGYRRYKVKK